MVACNFIDLKDRDVDATVGIKTLPVILGMKHSQRVIGTFFLLSYVLIGTIFNDMRVLFFSIAAGIIQFFLINRKKYKEWPVFLMYLLSLMVVLFILR